MTPAAYAFIVHAAIVFLIVIGSLLAVHRIWQHTRKATPDIAPPARPKSYADRMYDAYWERSIDPKSAAAHHDGTEQ